MDGNGKYLHIKNWSKFQHYKDRHPPWIKLYRSLLTDYTFAELPDKSKLDLVLLWLLASDHEGMIPDDADFLRRKLSISRRPKLEILKKQGFLTENASSIVDTEKRREEKRREERSKPVDKSLGKTLEKGAEAYLYRKHTDFTP